MPWRNRIAHSRYQMTDSQSIRPITLALPEGTAKAIEQAIAQLNAIKPQLDAVISKGVFTYIKALEAFKPTIESAIRIVQSPGFQAALQAVVQNAALLKLAMSPESIQLELPSKDEAAEMEASLDDPKVLAEANGIVAEWSKQDSLEDPLARGKHHRCSYWIAVIVLGLIGVVIKNAALDCVSYPVEKTLEQLFPVPDPQQSQLARQLESQGKMLEEVREGQARLERQVANLQNRLPVDGNRGSLATPNSDEEPSPGSRSRRKRPK